MNCALIAQHNSKQPLLLNISHVVLRSQPEPQQLSGFLFEMVLLQDGSRHVKE